MSKAFSVMASAAVLMLSACAMQSEVGTKLESTDVERIKKGVTTMAQVESMIGKPDSINMIEDGKKIAFYYSSQGESRSWFNPAALIPFAGLFVTQQATSTTRTQQLHITYNRRGVVEDYHFSDDAKEMEINVAPLGKSSIKQKRVPAEPAK